MISIRNLTKRFSAQTALDRVNCQIGDASIAGVVGTNGAGKSTLFRTMAGVYRPEAGGVFYGGEPVYENPGLKAAIVLVADETYFLPNASMRRQAEWYARAYPTFDWERFLSLSGLFELNVKKPVRTFSKGMRRQAAVVLALSCRPRYLLFDETFDGLDPVRRNMVRSLINREVEENRVTVVMSTHSVRELEGTCDQILFLHGGRLVLCQDSAELENSCVRVQIAFSQRVDQSQFKGMKILRFDQTGKVINMIVEGNREEIVHHLGAMDPVLLETLPVNMEELFLCKMQQMGYGLDGSKAEKGDVSR